MLQSDNGHKCLKLKFTLNSCKGCLCSNIYNFIIHIIYIYIYTYS